VKSETAWMERSACRNSLLAQLDAVVAVEDVFNADATDTLAAAQAKRVCRTCPVSLECLVYALNHHEPGVWGGTTEAERNEMRRRS
jgi:WhiB family transcriptional regulator, redox-sensing transcriptional regulator